MDNFMILSGKKPKDFFTEEIFNLFVEYLSYVTKDMRGESLYVDSDKLMK